MNLRSLPVKSDCFDTVDQGLIGFNATMENVKHTLNIKCVILNQLLEEALAGSYDKSGRNENLWNSFKDLQDNFLPLIPVVRRVESFSSQYDFNELIQGNGYRAYVKLFLLSVDKAIEECNRIKYGRKKWLFSYKDSAVKSLDTWNRIFASFNSIFQMLIKIHESSSHGCLIPPHSACILQNLEGSPKISTTVFYEENLGFQLVPCMRRFVKVWSIMAAVYSEVYKEPTPFRRYILTIFKGIKYLLSDEERARQYLKEDSDGSIYFFRRFLALADSRVALQFSYLLRRNVSVDTEISLPPVNLDIVTVDGSTVTITPPTVHIGLQPVRCKLLSARLRRGMPCVANQTPVAKPSTKLIIYYHGGGFISMTSSTCQMYTRDWSIKLDVPIFFVDYSLAPEARYPRQLEECFYAYCWALKNARRLGTTAEAICLCGDSAGGNLAVGVALKCIEHGIRAPSGVFAVYSPFVLEASIFPGRILCLIDPVVPFGFVTKCFEAYIGNPDDEILKKLQSLVTADDIKSTIDTSAAKSVDERAKGTSLSPKALLPSLAVSTSIRTTSLLLTCMKKSVRRVLSYVWSCLPSTKAIHQISDSAESAQSNIGKKAKLNGIRNRVNDRDTKTRFKRTNPMSIIRDVDGQQVIKEFYNCNISPDPYLSPYYSSQEVLSQLPKVHLMTTDMEVCLDDNVEFAKKLARCGVKVTLDILKGLPHGFLMFAMISKEGMEASDKAVGLIKDILEIEE